MHSWQMLVTMKTILGDIIQKESMAMCVYQKYNIIEEERVYHTLIFKMLSRSRASSIAHAARVFIKIIYARMVK